MDHYRILDPDQVSGVLCLTDIKPCLSPTPYTDCHHSVLRSLIMYMDTVVFASLLTVGLIVGFMGIWGYVVYQGLHNDHKHDE